jgi:hypothetical protein
MASEWTPERIAATINRAQSLVERGYLPCGSDVLALCDAARIGLAVVDPTDADVERVAKALAWREWQRWRPDPLAWESRDPATLRYWRDNARAAIAALGGDRANGDE